MKIAFALVMAFLSITCLSEVYQINLDLAPAERYFQISQAKRDSIASFIQHLKSTSQKYKEAFNRVAQLYSESPEQVRKKVGEQFFYECLSIARGADLPVSDIIVYNYMYQLGATTDFCTAITLSTENETFLGRNLDYGYQQYLANNSVQLSYVSKGKIVYETLGHAGFVGTHTALKRKTAEDPFQYGIVLNERTQQRSSKRLQKILDSDCETAPYALMKTLRYCSGGIKNVVNCLSTFNTCAAVYYITIDERGESYVIQKNSGKTVNLLKPGTNYQSATYIVKTNHDESLPDPDGRSTVATSKLLSLLSQKQRVYPSDVWKILLQPPNFNHLTLMSAMLDVKNGKVHHQVWYQ